MTGLHYISLLKARDDRKIKRRIATVLHSITPKFLSRKYSYANKRFLSADTKSYSIFYFNASQPAKAADLERAEFISHPLGACFGALPTSIILSY